MIEGDSYRDHRLFYFMSDDLSMHFFRIVIDIETQPAQNCELDVFGPWLEITVIGFNCTTKKIRLEMV